MDNFYGLQFGRLTPIKQDPDDLAKSFCNCDCGRIKSINSKNVKDGATKSCGCIRVERSKSRALDITNQRFGWLTAISRAENHVKPSGGIVSQWNCLCDCGNHIIMYTESLKSGNTKSCGCQHYQTGEKHFSFKHGLSGGHPLYNRLCHIIERCYRENHPNYPNYGGRGIKVFQGWLDDRKSFIDYIESLYPDDLYDLLEEGMSLDRIDVNGNYEPGNLKLATNEEQANNKTNNRIVNAFGYTLSLANAVRKFGRQAYGTVRHRLNSGFDPEKALILPTTHLGERHKDYDKPFTEEEKDLYKIRHFYKQ